MLLRRWNNNFVIGEFSYNLVDVIIAAMLMYRYHWKLDLKENLSQTTITKELCTSMQLFAYCWQRGFMQNDSVAHSFKISQETGSSRADQPRVYSWVHSNAMTLHLQ